MKPVERLVQPLAARVSTWDTPITLPINTKLAEIYQSKDERWYFRAYDDVRKMWFYCNTMQDLKEAIGQVPDRKPKGKV